jgi:hypothetical protein
VIGLSQGKADIELSTHESAAAVVHVTQVSQGLVDPASNLVVLMGMTTRVRIKLYLENEEWVELKPTLQNDGRITVKQNVEFRCVTD